MNNKQIERIKQFFEEQNQPLSLKSCKRLKGMVLSRFFVYLESTYSYDPSKQVEIDELYYQLSQMTRRKRK